MSKRVLMVDDEEDLVWSTARQVARERPDLQFEGLSNPEEALACVRRSPPDLLVTDIRMPKMNGLELILAARGVASSLPVVVITAYGTPEVRAEVQRSQGVEYVEKPFTLQALLAAVDRALSRDSGFSGAVSLPMLPDLLQLYAIARATGALRIAGAAQAGAMWFEGGEIVHAFCDAVQGNEAVYELLTWNGGRFTFDAGAPAPEHSIQSSWQELLVEGCRRLDEGRRDEAPGAAEVPGEHESLWRALGPLIAETAPRALVVAAHLSGGTAAVLPGQVPAGDWLPVIHTLLEGVARIAGPSARGSVECVGVDQGVAVVWDQETDLVLIFADGLEGRNGASRFRSNLARWRAACGQWIRGD